MFAVEITLWAGSAAAGYHWGARAAGPIGGIGLALAVLALIGVCWVDGWPRRPRDDCGWHLAWQSA